MRLQAKVAVITGGTSGIGRPLVERLAQCRLDVFRTCFRHHRATDRVEIFGGTFPKSPTTDASPRRKSPLAIATGSSPRLRLAATWSASVFLY